MPKSDRLFRLLQLLRMLPPPVTAARLAAEAGVSLRTLYRDIEALRAGGALIDGEAGFGYRLTEDPALPPQMFSRLEIEALVLALAEVQAGGDPVLAEAAQAAMTKIVATLPERVQRQALHAVTQVYRFHRPEPLALDLTPIREACWDERALDIRYIDAAEQRTKRRIWPLSIVHLDRSQMLLAWCCLRQDFRKFLLRRIESAALTEESFRPRRVPLLRQFLDQLNAGERENAGSEQQPRS